MPRHTLLSAIVSLIPMATLISCSQSQNTDSVDAQVDALYSRMTREERIAQICAAHFERFFDADGNLDTALCRQQLANGIGHFSQYAFSSLTSADTIRDRVAAMQAWLVANTPSGIPALFHEEVLTGVNMLGSTVYPQQIGLACSFNTELAEVKTRQTASALRRVGGMLALSPMVDVVRTPSFNRLEESYGEDAYLSAAMGVAFVRGLQGDDLARDGVAACTKHFLGYGGGGEAPEKELMEDILLPHEAIIRLANSQALMTGYHAFRGTKCVANRFIQRDILRNYLGFEGLTVSDYSSIGQIDDDLDDKMDKVQKAAAALSAGNNVDFPGGAFYSNIQEAIDKGLAAEADFEEAVKNVLRLKARLGLLTPGTPLYACGHIELDSPDERQTAYALATQSVVLLKNDGILPLKSPANIALTGPNANTMWAMLGDYTYQSMAYFWKNHIADNANPQIVSLFDGMKARLPEGSSLSYSRGCDWTEEVETVVEDAGDPRTRSIARRQNRKVESGEVANEAEALRMAAASDVIVAAVGENVMLSGENRDRLTLRLPGRQEQFVEKLIATGKPVVLVIFGGRAQVVSGLVDKCAAVIQAWYPGEEGGNALADILYGRVSPSGKLSVSYPSEEIWGEKVCYSYGNSDSRIAWPFGFGLSYTTFAYSDLAMPQSVPTSADAFSLSFTLTNTGSVPADEVAQVYVSPTDSAQFLSPIKLQGFKRVSLQPGESKTVTLSLSPQQFGHYADGSWHVLPGSYIVKVAASSADVRLESTITLVGDECVMPLRTHYLAE